MGYDFFYNATVVGQDKILCDASFKVENGIFTRLESGARMGDMEKQQGELCHDLHGKLVVPGFIDTHIHGFAEYDFESPACDFIKAGEELKKRGTTMFLATICPVDAVEPVAYEGRKETDTTLSSGERWRKDYSKTAFGNSFAGFHLEGPFLNPEMRGGFLPWQIIPFSQDGAMRLIEGFSGKVKILTASPESVWGEFGFLNELAKRNGFILSAGHTSADSEAARLCFSNGFSHVTHLYNAMRRQNHRTPSILEEALLNKNVVCEIIGDLHHVCEQSLRIAAAIKPPCGLIGITDSVCMSNTEGLTLHDGLVYHGEMIYGSQCEMREVFKNLAGVLKIPLTLAVRYTSYNAAKLLGLDAGEIAEGKRADFLVLNDKYEPEQVYAKGEAIEA